MLPSDFDLGIQPQRFSSWRVEEAPDLVVRNFSVNWENKPKGKGRPLIPHPTFLVVVAVFFLFWSAAEGFNNPDINIGLGFFAFLATLNYWIVSRLRVIFTSDNMYDGWAISKRLLLGAYVTDYGIVDHIQFGKNFGWPCLKLTSTASNFSLRIVAGLRVTSLVPVLLILRDHNLEGAFDEECCRLLIRYGR